MTNKSLKYILAGTLIFAQAKNIFAQNNQHCGTTEATQVLHAAHPELVQQEIEYNKALALKIKNKKQQKAQQTTETVYTIPIVFHIIHTFGSENISDAQIVDEVNILNRDYAKLNADTSAIVGNSPFDSLASNVHIQFRLAGLDPNGNCTNGIDRIYSHKTNNADDYSKLNQWPRNKYLNVWTVKTIGTAGVAGYAYFPADVSGTTSLIDGVLILSEYIGSIGTSSALTSRALTHEIGHYLSLYHPWGSTNSPEVACGDDLVQDTPVTRGHKSCDLWTPWCETHNFATPYNFNGVRTTSGTTDTTALTPSINTNFGSFSAVGVSANSSDSARFSFSKWGVGSVNGDSLYSALTGSINTSKYYQVTVTPAWGSTITLSSISFDFQRSATGVRSCAVRSSVDGFTTNLPATNSNSNVIIAGTNEFFYKRDTSVPQSGSVIALSGTHYTNVITPITFRFYGWNAEDSLGTFSIDNVNFAGASGIIENTQNYMDYSYCSVMFTNGQKERMRTAIESDISGRNNLWSASNLAATGTDGSTVQACTPDADFYANRYFVCEGTSVTFTDASMNATVASRVWSFPGGTPSTSTAQNPVVTFSTPNWQSVSLTSTNAMGSSTKTENNFVFVSPSWSNFYGTFSEGFEDPTTFNNLWFVENHDNNNSKFQLTHAASYTGNACLFLNAYSPVMYSSNSNPPVITDPGIGAGDVDDVISPSYDLSHVTSMTMNFKLSCGSSASTATNVTEMLKVYYSVNCGQTWLVLKTIQGTALTNAGYWGSSFVPSSQSFWTQQSINLTSAVAQPYVRFKFEYTSGAYSNNLYIDDINILGTVGINENSIEKTNLSVFPNPTNQSATISYTLSKEQNVIIEVYDILGNLTTKLLNEKQNGGEHAVTFDKQTLSSGTYIIKFSSDNNGVIYRKLILTQ